MTPPPDWKGYNPPERPPTPRRIEFWGPTFVNTRTEAAKADDRIAYALACLRSDRQYLESLHKKQAV